MPSGIVALTQNSQPWNTVILELEAQNSGDWPLSIFSGAMQTKVVGFWNENMKNYIKSLLAQNLKKIYSYLVVLKVRC